MNTTSPVSYFLYVRKSSESEDRQMASIQDQIDVMTQFAADQGLTIHEVITESKSAKKPGRPKYDEMIARIKQGEANGILCWKLNRLARNPVDGGEISWLLQSNIIQHIQTFGGGYQPSDNVLMMQVEFGIANQYVKNLSEDVIRGLSRKAKRGWFPSNRLALGYIHKAGYKMGEAEIIPDPKKFPLVKHLWELMLSGQHSVRAIQAETKRIGLLSSGGKPLSTSVLYRIFNNPFYAGYFEWKHEREGVIRHRGKHTPMVTWKQFERIQTTLGKRGSSLRASQGYDFRYRGPFRCGECSGHITAEHKLQVICTTCKKKFSAKTRTDCPQCQTDISEMSSPSIVDKTYYRCTKNAGACSQPCAEEKDLEAQILEALSHIPIPKSMVELMIANVEQAESTSDPAVEDAVQSQHEDARNQLENLIKMRISGEIDQDTFLEHKANLESSLTDLEQRLQFQNDSQAWKNEAIRDLEVAAQAASILEKMENEQVRTLISKVASNPVIQDRKPLFHLKKPFLFYRKMYELNKAKMDSFEPKKALDKQGLSGGIRWAFPIGRGNWNDLRTLYEDEND